MGLTRPFRVVAIQSDPSGSGIRQGQPLLSAREVDQELMWRRAAQIMQVCVEVGVLWVCSSGAGGVAGQAGGGWTLGLIPA